jgi:hypothetical protein
MVIFHIVINSELHVKRAQVQSVTTKLYICSLFMVYSKYFA